MPVGVAVTLRRARMWEFLDRLISIAIPRIRDFRGLNPRSFDGRGNYSMGIREQIIFPEIDYDSIDEVRGLDITITTTRRRPTRRPSRCSTGSACRSPRRAGPGEVDKAAEEEEERRKEEARQRAEAEEAALEQLKEENPEAYAKPREARGGRGGRGGRGARARATATAEAEGDEGRGRERGLRRRRRRKERLMAKTSQRVGRARKPKFKIARVQPLPPVRALARLLPQVRPLPDLPARAAHEGYVPGMTKSSW